jgi:hypothetical protein
MGRRPSPLKMEIGKGKEEEGKGRKIKKKGGRKKYFH